MTYKTMMTMIARSFVAFLALLVPGIYDCHAAGVSFYDTFQSFDSSRWLIANNWTNGDHQSCTWSRDNLNLVPGRISLTVNDTPSTNRKYSCAEVQSHEVYGYGTYEVRMKSVANPGLVSAFFTYIGPPQGKLQDEIDFEFIGTHPSAVNVAYYAKGNGGRSLSVPLDFNATEGFHDYAFVWAPDRISWFADHKLLHEMARSADDVFPTEPGKIVFSIWTGSDMLKSWLDSFSYRGKPLVAEYQFIAYTKLGEPCQFPNSIACKFGPIK